MDDWRVWSATIDPYDPKVAIIEVRKDHQCLLRGAGARQAMQPHRKTRDTLAVSIFCFVVSIHVFM